MGSRLLLLTALAAAAVALPRSARAQAVSDTTRTGVGVRLAFPDGIAGLRLPGPALIPPRGALGNEAVQARFRAGLDDELAAHAARRQRQRLLARLYRGDSLALALRLDPSLGPRAPRDVLGLDRKLRLKVTDSIARTIKSTRPDVAVLCTSSSLKDVAGQFEEVLKLRVPGRLLTARSR